MYTIQINHDDYPAELSPACEVFTSAHVSEAAAECSQPVTHSLTSVVLPKPAGAETRVSL